MQDLKVTVVGAGSWGRTFAELSAKRGHDVVVWSRTPKFMTGGVRTTTDLTSTLNAEIIILAVPVQQLGSVLRSSTDWRPNAYFVSLAKGIEQERLLRVSQICGAEIPGFDPQQFASLSGPTLAEEIAQGMPATAVAASVSQETASHIQQKFSGPNLRLYSSDDVVGVELAGAMKNVIALAAGICSGLKLGQNVLGALITRGLAEMTRLGEVMGGKRATFSGLAGMGDLVTTCSSPLSRNRAVGMRIAHGEQLDEILSSMHEVAEGVWTAKAALKLAQNHDIEMPITTAVCHVLYEGKPPQDAIRELMTRSLKAEL